MKYRTCMCIRDSVIWLHRELRSIKIGKWDVYKGSQNKNYTSQSKKLAHKKTHYICLGCFYRAFFSYASSSAACGETCSKRINNKVKKNKQTIYSRKYPKVENWKQRFCMRIPDSVLTEKLVYVNIQWPKNYTNGYF